MKYSTLFKSLLAALLLAVPALLSAAPVSRQQAQAIATTFMQQRGMAATSAPKLTYRMPGKASDSYYYVFNAGHDKGFVIVSGDDRTPQVLGYSDKGSLDMDNVPMNIRAFLQTYADEIKRLDDAGVSSTLPAVTRKAEKVKYPVSPLLRTEWNQDSPYNNNCPVVNGRQTVTGCVATATAQAMAYFRWPANTTAAIPSYTSTGNNLGSTTLSGVPAGTSLDWDNIVDDYSGTTTTAQQNAVANLMLYVGESVQMSYNIAENGGSGAVQSAIAPALTTYFDYSAHNLDRSACTLAQFEDSIFNEVANSRPVIFSGSSSGGGHCFVIDGYDGEGLFHVNWGWGGMSDGYFLLSVLNPDNNSGIGASTTSDGYSMDQSAVIGLAKGSSSAVTSPIMLSVYDQTVSDGTVTLNVYNLTGNTYNFDVSIASIADDGTATPLATVTENYSLESNYGFQESFALKDLGLRAGTYHIVLASKKSGTSEWLYSEKDVIEVTTDGNGNVVSARMASDFSNLSVTAWEPVGTLTAASEQPVNITLANSGSEFYGTVYLFASQSSSKGNIQSQTGLTAAAHGSTTIQMSFDPYSSGTYTLWLCSDANGNNVIGSTTVSVSTASSSTANLASSFTPSNGSTIYGKFVEGTCRITNNGSSAYNGYIATAVFDVKNDYANVGQSSQNVSIPAGGSVDIQFSYKEPAGQYLIAAYANNDNEIGAPLSLTLADGIITYNADGNKTGQAASSSLTVGSDAVAIDLTGVENTVTQVNTTNANPNALYYFSSANAPAVAGLKADGRNVVIGSTADNLTITDGNDFYCPTAFTAANATYTRSAAIGTSGTGGWETICLPFEASTVSANGQALHWFTSAEDRGRDFWLMEFAELDGNTVVFDFNSGSAIKANTPYIIAVPDSHWGEQYSLVGKPMSFSGTNVEVKPTNEAKILISTSAYNFVGSTVATSTANDFLMNNGGTAFARTASATSAPFRAFFRAKGDTGSQPQVLRVRVPGDTTTGITNVSSDDFSDNNAPAYNLAGQRVGKDYKGIVIRNGKKVIVK